MLVGHRPALTSLWVAAGPQSIIIWVLSSWATKAEPNLVGVGVGVPAPRMCIRAIVGAVLSWIAASVAGQAGEADPNVSGYS